MARQNIARQGSQTESREKEKQKDDSRQVTKWLYGNT